MLTDWELAEEARIQRIAKRSHGVYLGYCKRFRTNGSEGRAYWFNEALKARKRYQESVDYVKTYS